MYVLMISLLALFSQETELTIPVELLTESQVIEIIDSEAVVRIPSGLPGATGGMPDLPIVPYTVELPDGCSPEALIIIEEQWEDVLADVRIKPLPEPVPLVLEPRSTAPLPDPGVYGIDAFWPASPAILTGQGFRNGRPVACLQIMPYRYNPVTGSLQKLCVLRIEISSEPLHIRPLESPRTDEQRMLIVTDDSLVPVFEELAQRRTDEGIIAEVVPMSTVYASASGRDDAEKLRNYIISCYTTDGLDYVLLGGDTDLVPFRFAFAMECEAGLAFREDSLPCDLYFSDLDGSWDANGNNIFGEIDDDIDLFPDVFVGRATVENTSEAEAWLGKLIAYEDCLQEDHFQKALFLAMILWLDPYTDSAVSKNLIDELSIPDYIDITKLYQSLGNENLGTTMLAMNEGQNFINHDGHAWWSSLGLGSEYMNADHLDAINSNGRYASLMYSIGCWSAAFDFDAVAEHFLTNPVGCGILYIGNSSYGWGSPGNPANGYSDVLDRIFFDQLYEHKHMRAGELLAATKEFYIPYSQWENVYRWHEYDVNLLGDPSFRPYRKYPLQPDIDCLDFVCSNTSFFPVQVSGCITDGLMLCVHDEGNNYFVQELDNTGYVSFELTHPPTGSFTVTVTGSYIRRSSLTVEEFTGPDPVVSDLLIDDTGGDGFLSPGDLANISLTLMNQGTEDLSGVSLLASVTSGPAIISGPSMTFSDLSAGASGTGSEPLNVEVLSTASNGNVASFNLEISSDQGTWNIGLPLLIYAPGLYFATYSVDDSGNNFPEPGESFQLTLNIANLGLLDAEDVSLVMTEYPNWVTWVSDSAWCASVPINSTSAFELTCQLSATAPSPSFPWLMFELTSATASYQTTDTLRLAVGETGISNDVESGEAGWTHSGTSDMWNITESVSHSPTHSWFCGGASGYVPGMDCGLQSPTMILAPDASFSFWTTFDVAIYGTDGLYPLLHNLTEATTDTLDFIGSGGALGPDFGRGNGTGWVTYSYDLSWVEAGDEVQIEFRFISDLDSDTGNGFYIDDIIVEGGYAGSMSNEWNISTPMGNPFPNPAFSSFSIPLLVDDFGQWTLGIYDLSGRLVKSLEGSSPVNELVVISTDGLASGIYMIRLSGVSLMNRRIVVLD